jgi:AcrR family transcriptional regulator
MTMPDCQTLAAGAHGPAATAMLDAAERLFALKGIDAVSIREIVRAAGQSNPSALHYHFGSREALIGALMERRIRALGVTRGRRFDEWLASSRPLSVHGLIAMTIDVLAEVVRDEPWGPDYVRVAAQALFSPGFRLRKQIDPSALDSQNRINDALRRLLPDVPARVFEVRIRILTHEAIYSIARWVQSNGAVTPHNARHFEDTLRLTTDFLAAGLAAPGISRKLPDA